jgi:hypothetical protein
MRFGPEYPAQGLHGGFKIVRRDGTGFGLEAAQHEKIVCNLRRDQGPNQAVTAPAAFPLACDDAPAGVSRIAIKQLLNFIEAEPDLSHAPLQTWFGSHIVLCSLTASGAVRTILGRGKKLVKAPAAAVSHWIGRPWARPAGVSYELR